MAPNPSDNNALQPKSQNSIHEKKTSIWKLLCPCFSSKNSDSDKDQNIKDSYFREEFYQEKTQNQQNVHEDTETNLPRDFKISGFSFQNCSNPLTLKENPEFPIKNETKSASKIGIKFNIKRNSTLEGYKNENKNPNIQSDKHLNEEFLQNEKIKLSTQKPKKINKYQPSFAIQVIDYKKMQKDRKYLINILKSLQKMSGTNGDFAFLKNSHQHFQRQYPINLLQENKLIVVGEKNHKLLAKITSAKLYPSTSSVRRLKESLQSKEINGKFLEKDEKFNKALDRYWERRYFLFEKFDEGIQLDEQSWYSVTPESVADYISSRINVKNTLLDAFCGAGGDSLKLAGSCINLISNDIDPVKIKCLSNNAKIYDVQNITLINSDFFKLNMQTDAVYLAPPWGGLDYYKIDSFHPADFQPRLTDIIQKAFTISTNIFMLLPINTNIEALASVIHENITKLNDFKPQSCAMRIQKLFYNDSLKFLLVKFGDSSLISDIKLSEELTFIYDMLREDDQTYFKHKKLIRTIREKYGMVKLLNFVFEAENYANENQKNNWKSGMIPMIEKFQKYLLRHNLIDEKNLYKIKQEQQKEYEYDLKHRDEKNKKLKEKKIHKFFQKQGKTYEVKQINQKTLNCVVKDEEDQLPVSQIVKRIHQQNHQSFNRKQTFDSNIDIQSGIHESSQEPCGRDSFRTVSIISQFHEQQLRNINKTERGTVNSQFSVKDSIHQINKCDDFEISIDSRSRISQESGRIIPNSAQKHCDQIVFDQRSHRASEPIRFEKKQAVKMKKLKAGTVYQKEITEQAHIKKDS